ncbi:hypothetical protein OY671_005062 [Metschnikowia pulcherrima]|nr:hypothetical protein OY671_005062 [Metschnikowia pulcherrima]
MPAGRSAAPGGPHHDVDVTMVEASRPMPTTEAPKVPSAPAGTLYRGREGMWSWVAHRVTGVLIFFFSLVHVLDTALVRVSPEAYNAVIGTYQTPIMGIGEAGSVAAIVFHAFNGIRIISVDFWSKGPRYQRTMLWVVVGSFVVTMAGGASMAAAPTVEVASPRDPYKRRKATRSNYESYSWIFMRASGVVSIVLIFGHSFVNLMVGEGVHAIDFGFVAGKWASPFWQIWDSLMSWLAMFHGTNGVRTIINDYAERDGTRLVLKLASYLAFTIVTVLGTLVIFTFEPCPANAPAESLASFCTA